MTYRDPKTGRWAKMPAALHKVFVYGTLKRGEGNHGLLEDERFLGEAVTGCGFTMTTLGCPYVIMVGNDVIKGEVYEVDDEKLVWLDRLESYVPGRAGNHYDRVEIDVEMLGEYMSHSHGAQVKAFIYVLKNPRRAYPYYYRDNAGRITWSSENAAKAIDNYHDRVLMQD